MRTMTARNNYFEHLLNEMKESTESRFFTLVERVQACRRCPRMEGSARVLSAGCGPLDSKLVFVGEAPGRLGADGSHLPFHGDKSGHNFESLIEQVGISRYQVFVTNAVLCNPKDALGNNATPSPTEIANCADFLKDQLEILKPEIVVTLGAVALRACSMIDPHALVLKEHVRTRNKWFGRNLVPIYHPGQRAMMHRSFANQLADYQFVAELSRRGGKAKEKTKPSGQRGDAGKLATVVSRLVDAQPEGISYFALHKLYFLAEVAHLEATSERITNSYVVRQKEGPYCVDLHLAKLPNLVHGLIMENVGGLIRLRRSHQLNLVTHGTTVPLRPSEITAIDAVIARYGKLSDSELKRAAYLSKPMRAMLRREKALHANLFNAAVLPYQTRS